MPASALALALAAAVLHAAWNLLLAGAEDTRATTAAALALVSAACLPLAIATWDVDAAALPYVVASVACEIAYFGLLATAYARADLGVVYPIARGGALVAVLVAGAALGRGDPDAVQAAGVLLVAAGIVVLQGAAGPAGTRDAALALAVAATIAGYTLADDRGLEDAATVPYLALVVGIPGVVYAVAFAASAGAARVRTARVLAGRVARSGPAALARPAMRRAVVGAAAREGVAAVRGAMTARAAGVGAAMLAAFGLALAALELADPAPVAAVRESSVVIAAVLAGSALGERGGAVRIGGAAGVFTGVAAMALG